MMLLSVDFETSVFPDPWVGWVSSHAWQACACLVHNHRAALGAGLHTMQGVLCEIFAVESGRNCQQLVETVVTVVVA